MATRAKKKSSALEPPSTRELLTRLLLYAKPYFWVIVLMFGVTTLMAGGQYGRTILMMPLIDDVLIPIQSISMDLEGMLHGEVAAAGEGLEATSEAEAIREKALTTLWQLTIFAFFLIVIVPLAVFARGYIANWVMGRISVDLRVGLAEKLLAMPLSFHRSGTTGDLLSRALNDATHTESAIKMVIDEWIKAGVKVVVGVGTMLAISFELTIVTLVTAPIIIGILTFFSTKIRRGAQKRQAQLSEVVQRLTGILSGIKVIKAFSGQSVELKAFRDDTEMHFKRSMKVVMNRVASRSLVDMVNNGSLVAILFLGGWLIMESYFDLTIGKLTSFSATMALTYKPVKVLSRGWARMADALSSADRYFEILDSTEEPADTEDSIGIDGVHDSIAFKGVSFSYGREPVLDCIDLTVQPGEVIAIVGPTGGGKTTLVDLLLRFHDVDAGSVEIDGVDIRRIKRDSLLEHVSVVTQEPFLFDTTILENIRYGRPNATDRELLEAAKAAHVDEYVDQLSEGYDTRVGEFGLQLSGGQRQRITIARAILKQPAILVFDEATSSLDAKTERTVQEAINSLRGQRTIFIVAHRLSTIRSADRIVVIDDGHVTQLGTHDELVAQPGLYAELVSLQIERNEDSTPAPT